MGQTTINFRTYKCRLAVGHYNNNRIALSLVGASNGAPIATATVNLPEEQLPKNHVFIKNWSENAGVLQALIAAGYIETTGTTVPTGFVQAHMVELTPRALALVDQMEPA